MAAGVELATAYVSLAVSAKDVVPQTRKAFSGVEREADATGKRGGKKMAAGFGSAAKGIAGMFAGAMAGIAVGNFLKDSVAEARESQKVGALTANVIKQTGGAAKITAKQVGDLATAISNKTGIDDEAIQTGSNLLLTFKNVRNEAGKGSDVFNRATQAAVDLSAAGFGSVDGAAKMLGKALNDPLKGISALGRAGVTFTAGQKKQIEAMVKAGDVLGAQKIIMKEVESQVGGAAAASATAGEKMSVVWGNFKETIGTRLLPIIDKLAGFLTSKLIPAAGQLFDVLFQGDFSSGPLSEDSKIVDVLFKIRDGVKATFGVAKQLFGILFQGDFKGGPLSEDSKIVDVLFNIRDGLKVTAAAAKQVFGVLFQGDFKSGPLSEDGKFVDVLFRVREGFFKLRDGAVALGGWLKGELWPALKDARDTIMPGVKKAIDIVKGGGGSGGGVDGLKVGFQKFGEILVSKIIPFIAKLVSVWLPYAAFQLRIIIEVVKGLWKAFQAFHSVAVTVISAVIRTFLTMVGAVVNGAAKAFGWVPGLGGKLKTAASEFNKFRDKVNASLDGIKDKKVTVGVSFVAGSRVVLSEKSSGGGRNTGGGSTKFATGGVLPGYTPGRDVHEFYSPTAGRLGLSGGEAIMRPEFTRMVGGKSGVDRLNAMARNGSLRVQGFASGGVFARVPSRRGIDEGVDNATLDVVAKSAKMLQAAAQSMAGGPGMGWRAQVAWAKANIPSAAITSTVRNNNAASDHDRGRAIDLAGGPGMSRIFDVIKAAFGVGNIRSLYYSPKGARQVRFNRESNTPPHIYSSHFDHVHWAMANGGVIPRIKPTLYDQGGVLKPGLTMVNNQTGGNETVIPAPPGELIDYDRLADAFSRHPMFLDGEQINTALGRRTSAALTGGRSVLVT